MIGIATAALLELTTTANGVFVNIGLKNTPLLCVVLMATAAALAGATRQGSGAQPLLEPVLASLTSKARSLSSVSFQASEGAKDIDVYVDRIFKVCLDWWEPTSLFCHVNASCSQLTSSLLLAPMSCRRCSLLASSRQPSPQRRRISSCELSQQHSTLCSRQKFLVPTVTYLVPCRGGLPLLSTPLPQHDCCATQSHASGKLLDSKYINTQMR